MSNNSSINTTTNATIESTIVEAIDAGYFFNQSQEAAAELEALGIVQEPTPDLADLKQEAQEAIQQKESPAAEPQETQEAPAPQTNKGKCVQVELGKIGKVWAKGNLDIALGQMVSMCISSKADDDGKAEMKVKARELASNGYNLVFSGLRPEDMVGINAALGAGGKVVIFTHEGLDFVMHSKAVLALKEEFQKGNILFLSYHWEGGYTLERAQQRNRAVAQLCSSVFVAQASASIKLIDGKKQWDGQGAWDLVFRFSEMWKAVYMPVWDEFSPVAMLVLSRKVSAIEIADATEIVLDQSERLRSAMENEACGDGSPAEESLS